MKWIFADVFKGFYRRVRINPYDLRHQREALLNSSDRGPFASLNAGSLHSPIYGQNKVHTCQTRFISSFLIAA